MDSANCHLMKRHGRQQQQLLLLWLPLLLQLGKHCISLAREADLRRLDVPSFKCISSCLVLRGGSFATVQDRLASRDRQRRCRRRAPERSSTLLSRPEDWSIHRTTGSCFVRLECCDACTSGTKLTGALDRRATSLSSCATLFLVGELPLP